MARWELARYTDAKATQSEFAGLVVIVSGEKPTPSYDVRVISVRGAHEPTFRVEWRDEGGPSPDVETGFTAAAAIKNAPDTDEVVIESQAGKKKSPVTHFVTAQIGGGGGEIGIPLTRESSTGAVQPEP